MSFASYLSHLAQQIVANNSANAAVYMKQKNAILIAWLKQPHEHIEDVQSGIEAVTAFLLANKYKNALVILNGKYIFSQLLTHFSEDISQNDTQLLQ